MVFAMATESERVSRVMLKAYHSGKGLMVPATAAD